MKLRIYPLPLHTQNSATWTKTTRSRRCDRIWKRPTKLQKLDKHVEATRYTKALSLMSPNMATYFNRKRPTKLNNDRVCSKSSCLHRTRL